MKGRIFTLTVIFAVLLTALSGCTPKLKTERTIPKCFDTIMEITHEDMTYQATASRLDDGVWIIELTSPEAVKGLVYNINSGSAEISFKGLHFTFDTQKFPVSSVISIAIASIDKLAPMTLDLTQGETLDISSGEADGLTYSLTMDKNGTPQSLELGDYGMSIKFSGFTELEQIELNDVFLFCMA